MTVAHAAPYTVGDLAATPDDGRRYEVLEGALIVSPAPDVTHQVLGDRLRTRMEEAAPAGVSVVTAVTVRFDDETGLIPDVVVTVADLALRPTVLRPEDVLAVVEIVSPSSRSRDRVLKPNRYAAFGIDCYWRVELDPFPGQGTARLPTVLVHERAGEAYREVERLAPGSIGVASCPFPVDLDPAGLLRRR